MRTPNFPLLNALCICIEMYVFIISNQIRLISSFWRLTNRQCRAGPQLSDLASCKILDIFLNNYLGVEACLVISHGLILDYFVPLKPM